jgi:type I restriction enzyme S subunit
LLINEKDCFSLSRNSYYEKIGNETRCIDEEIPFEVPEGWEWVKIKNISQSYIGLTYAPKEVVQSDGIIVLRSSNIQNGKICLSDIVRVNKGINEKLFVSENDILICARNGSKKLVGKSAIIGKLEQPMTFGAFMTICKTPIYQYVYNFLQSDYFFNQLHVVSGTTTVNQLTQENFNNFFIPIPPLFEQQRIVNQLEILEPLIAEYDKYEKKEAQLTTDFPEKLKKSILQYAIQGKLVAQNPDDEPASVLLEKIRKEKEQLIKAGKLKRDKNESFIFKNTADNSYYEKTGGEIRCIDEELPFEIPESWAWVRIKSIADIALGKTLDKQKNKGIFKPYLRSVNVRWGSVDLEDIKEMRFEESETERYSIKFNDLLICEGGEAGRCAVYKNNTLIRYQNAIHRVRFKNDINPDFYMYVIWYYYSSHILDDYCKGVTIKHLTGQAIDTLYFPLPPISKQKAIVKAIDNMFCIINGIE